MPTCPARRVGLFASKRWRTSSQVHAFCALAPLALAASSTAIRPTPRRMHGMNLPSCFDVLGKATGTDLWIRDNSQSRNGTRVAARHPEKYRSSLTQASATHKVKECLRGKKLRGSEGSGLDSAKRHPFARVFGLRGP